jgi:hypothetical protein
MSTVRRIGILALAGCSACGVRWVTPRPLARPASPAEIREIRQERTPCYGTCPVYVVTFSRDGTAEYRGKAYVHALGTYRANIDSATFAQLAAHFVAHGYFSLRPHYAASGTDQPTVITTVLFDADSAVVDRYGAAGPWLLLAIEDQVDSVAAHLTWTRVP